MTYFLYFVFVFYIGSTVGYFLELFYRRWYHKKWVNPGLLIGPYLPIYGFGLCTLTLLYIVLSKYNVNFAVIILLMGLSMTLIEYIGGLMFLKIGVKLWDYSDLKFNYKGIICPQFTVIWLLLSAVFYYFVAKRIILAVYWFENNLSFSFILGLFFGIIIIDYIYSTKTYVKIRKFAKDNDLVVRYEEFKKYIKDIQDKNKEKYSFIFPFKQSKSLKEYFDSYKKSRVRKPRKFIFGLIHKNK